MALKDDAIQYYVDMLILQYNNKPKAIAHVETLIGGAVADLVHNEVVEGFNINTAVGVQLDTLGSIVGVSRSGNTLTRSITLDDADYRQLIKIGIVSNASKSSLYDIQDLLNTFFANTLIVFDTKEMAMSYFFDSSIGSVDLAEMFVVNGLLPKPMGVQLASLIYSDNVLTFFGGRTYDIPAYNNSGFNTYDVYSMTSPWMSYKDSISV